MEPKWTEPEQITAHFGKCEDFKKLAMESNKYPQKSKNQEKP